MLAFWTLRVAMLGRLDDGFLCHCLLASSVVLKKTSSSGNGCWSSSCSSTPCSASAGSIWDLGSNSKGDSKCLTVTDFGRSANGDGSSGLKGRQFISPGHRPGNPGALSAGRPERPSQDRRALSGLLSRCAIFPPGRCPGLVNLSPSGSSPKSVTVRKMFAF